MGVYESNENKTPTAPQNSEIEKRPETLISVNPLHKLKSIAS